MVTEKSYYSALYEKLVVGNYDMFSSCMEREHRNIGINVGFFEWLYNLLKQVEDKYEFDMQKMILPNYEKFASWQERYMGGTDIEKIEIATEFIIFCCLVDKILDSERFTDEEKKMVIDKIAVNNFSSMQEFESDNFIELDMMLNKIRLFILKIQCGDSEKEKLMESMDRAFASEIYMYRNKLGDKDSIKKQDYHFLVDKSVEFEKAAFMLATYTYNSEESEIAANNVGEIFWLTDDLCDLIEDVKYRRRNSVLFIGIDSESPMDISNRMEYAVDNMDMLIERLIKNLYELKANSCDIFYGYIVNEVWEWCIGVRKTYM
jgi:hypothetical protein